MAHDEAIVDDETGELIFRFETSFRKHPDAREVLDFSVMLNGYEEFEDRPTTTVAHLKGFLIQQGHLPHEGSRGWFFDIFDMRSQHAMIAFHVLKDNADLIEDALQMDTDFDDLSSVALIERIWVHPGLRGRKIAQRLLREAQHVLSRDGLLILMKAHPDVGRGKRKHQGLAAYYMSDESLNLREIDAKKHPGWLVAAWEDYDPPADDESYLIGDVGPLKNETDPHD